MKHLVEAISYPDRPLSVLSVEPYGMKHCQDLAVVQFQHAFSALGRAVWDETSSSK